MQGVTLLKRDVTMLFAVVLAVIILAFGFGYFFGRYEQIVINKSLLQEVPDVNCGSKT